MGQISYDNTSGDISPALRFVNTIYCGCGAKVRVSKQDLRWIICEAVNLAIKAGMKFYEEDFEYRHRLHRGSIMLKGAYANASGEGCGEHFYTLAVEVGNISACQAFEHLVSRKPFMWQGKRLAVRSELEWNGLLCMVNSFASDQSYANLAHYPAEARKATNHGVYYSGRPIRLFKVTHKELRAAQRQAKEAPND